MLLRRLIRPYDLGLQRRCMPGVRCVRPMSISQNETPIPQAPSFPIVGSVPYFLKAGGMEYIHAYIDGLHNKLGPIFSDAIGGEPKIFISDPALNMKIYQSESTHPQHLVPEAWKLYLQKTNQQRGLFFMDGHEWKEKRIAMNNIMLHPKATTSYVPILNDITSELMEAWKLEKNVKHLEYHLYNWNVECIGYFTLGKRLGFLRKLTGVQHLSQEDIEREHAFVTAIYSIFKNSVAVETMGAKLAMMLRLPAWNRFENSVSTALTLGNMYVQKAIEEYDSTLNQHGLVSSMMRMPGMDASWIKILIVDLILGGADTTTQAAQWALYLLGKHPEISQKARLEAIKVTSNGKDVTAKTLNQLVYIRSIIKETLRLYPVAPFLTRKLTTDILVQNYRLPANTWIISSCVSMAKNPEYFGDPTKFIPERWIRNRSDRLNGCTGGPYSKSQLTMEPKANVPWGLGARSCIGRPFAQDELLLIIVQTLINFEWHIPEEISAVTRMVTVPSKPINIQFKSR